MLYVCMCVCVSVVMFSFEQIVSILYKSCLILLFFFCASSTFLLMFCTEGNTILPETRRENWWTDRYKVQVGLHFDTYFFEFKDPNIYCRISNWQNETRQIFSKFFFWLIAWVCRFMTSFREYLVPEKGKRNIPNNFICNHAHTHWQLIMCLCFFCMMKLY